MNRLTHHNFKFKVGEKCVLKENLLIVEIENTFVYKGSKKYEVKYSHLETKLHFTVLEYELDEIPVNYNQKIFNAYIEYRTKYYELLERLYTPSVRDKY